MAWRGAIFLATFFLFCALPLRSHDPITTKLTWSQEISRIVYKRCVGCHRPDGAAFSLLKYEDARPWAKAIRDQVRNRTMPPWGAVKGVGDFANDSSLSEPEIDTLILWVEGGAPEGDPAYLPREPRAPDPKPVTKFGKQLAVNGIWKASTATRLAAVEPKRHLELWVERKDGAIDRLLWTRTDAKQQYIFRDAVMVHPGDVVHSTGPALLWFR